MNTDFSSFLVKSLKILSAQKIKKESFEFPKTKYMDKYLTFLNFENLSFLTFIEFYYFYYLYFNL